MRRVDAIAIVLGVFVAGGLAYLLFQLVGLDSQQAGIWSQVLLVSGLIGWLVTYVSRAVAKKMTSNNGKNTSKLFLKSACKNSLPKN
jgi:high-affinity Fe2+/Pb2+ permease